MTTGKPVGLHDGLQEQADEILGRIPEIATYNDHNGWTAWLDGDDITGIVEELCHAGCVTVRRGKPAITDAGRQRLAATSK